jgi:Beta-galactosidase
MAPRAECCSLPNPWRVAHNLFAVKLCVHFVKLCVRLACLLTLFTVKTSASQPAQAWNDYQIIEWQHRDAAQLATLKQLGFTAAAVIANRDGTGTPVQQQFAPMLANGLHWYVENIATDFYSAYHRWFPNQPVNWRFLEVQHRYQQNPDDQTALWRDPSFADPIWQQKICDRLMTTVHEEARYHPLYYNLGDETGIADLSAYWDFDLSPDSLAGMRKWLRTRYGSLAALNAEWGSNFAHWDDVQPETTRQAMRRTDDNFAAWADFKAWMDVSFAQALRMGTDAVHKADPSALAAIEGVQVPGWGGYDYSLLVGAVDVMELDDLPLAHSLNPALVTLTTSFRADPENIHDIWRDLLAGSRGLILWDSKNTIVGADATLGERGRAYAEAFAEIRGGIGALLMTSKSHTDPVAILYSPASFRTQWMLEQKPKGDAWIVRTAEDEIGDNAARDAMWAYARSIEHLGLQPAYVSTAMLTRGDLKTRGIKLLVLPHAIAISSQEAQAIRDFAAGGGTVIADVQPGEFDAHSRRLPQPSLAAGVVRIIAPNDMGTLAPKPVVQINAPNADVVTHIWHHGDKTIIGLQRDLSPTATDEPIVLTLPQAADVYDLRKRQKLGHTDRVTLTLDAVYPAVLAITP